MKSLNQYLLDCSSFESTLTSIAHIYDSSENKVLEFLGNLDLDDYYNKHKHLGSGDYVTIELFEKEFGKQKHDLEYVYWFHLTRTIYNNKFVEGILPLSRSLAIIWSNLLTITQNTIHYPNLIQLKRNGVSDYQYNLKVDDTFHSGPFAMLVRDSAFHSDEMCNHDYLRTPEIIEDICNDYIKKYKTDLMDFVNKNLYPCIIKFGSKKRLGQDCIQAAMFYLYCKIHNEEFSTHSNTCFDNENETIMYNQIESVEFI